MRKFKQHPIGKLLPAMTAEEYAFVLGDIGAHGLHDPILLLDNQVLDGWHRYLICLELGIKPTFKTLENSADALAMAISRNLARRQLLPSQRYGVYQRIAAASPEVQASIDAIKQQARKRQQNGTPCPNDRTRVSHALAKAIGVGHATIEKMDRLKRLDPEACERVVDGEVSLGDALQNVATEQRRQKQTALLPTPGFKSEVRLHCGDFRTVLDTDDLPPLALMIVDPPWDHVSLDLWQDVGRLAAKALRPSGMLVAYAPKMYITEVIVMLREHLSSCRWPFAMIHGKVERKRPEGILSKWQPVFLFSKGKLNLPLAPLDVPGEDCGLPEDVLKQSGAEKDRHPWQRPLSEHLHWIKHLTRPKRGKQDADWVLDPCAGSFGSGKAAQLLGRNYIGVDIEQKYVAKGRAWINQKD